jgi:hypothetical protein
MRVLMDRRKAITLVPMRRYLVRVAKGVLPRPVFQWYRRRLAAGRYLRALGYELYDRRQRLDPDEAEGRIAAHRDGFYSQVVKEALERTDLILQELDRRIEGLSARQGNKLRAHDEDMAHVKTEMAALRSELAALASRVESLRAEAESVRPAFD